MKAIQTVLVCCVLVCAAQALLPESPKAGARAHLDLYVDVVPTTDGQTVTGFEARLLDANGSALPLEKVSSVTQDPQKSVYRLPASESGLTLKAHSDLFIEVKSVPPFPGEQPSYTITLLDSAGRKLPSDTPTLRLGSVTEPPSATPVLCPFGMCTVCEAPITPWPGPSRCWCTDNCLQPVITPAPGTPPSTQPLTPTMPNDTASCLDWCSRYVLFEDQPQCNLVCHIPMAVGLAVPLVRKSMGDDTYCPPFPCGYNGWGACICPNPFAPEPYPWRPYPWHPYHPYHPWRPRPYRPEALTGDVCKYRCTRFYDFKASDCVGVRDDRNDCIRAANREYMECMRSCETGGTH